MKAYRITDDFKIVRYGNRLRFEIVDQIVDDIDGDDVAEILRQLLDIQSGRNAEGWTKRDDDGNVLLEMRVRQVCLGLRTSVEFFTLKNVDNPVKLFTDAQLFKLFNVLSFILPKLCEEGIV